MRKADFALTLGLLACGALLSPACQCGRLELGPSNLLAPGRFQGLWGFPYGEKQAYLLADALDADKKPTGKLGVVDVAKKTACQIDIMRPAWFWSMGKSLLVFENIDWDRWTGRVSRVTLPCGPTEPLLENVYLSIWREEMEAGFYAVADVDGSGQGRVVHVSWPGGVTEEMRANQSTDYFDFDWPGRRYFHRENGELLARGLDGRLEGRLGQGVTSYVSSGDGEVLYQEGPSLTRAKTDGTAVRALSQSGCSASYAAENIAYLEPCDGAPKQLVLLDRTTSELVGRYGSAIDHYRVGPEKWLSWMEGKVDGDGPGSLWVKPPAQDPILVGGSILSWHLLTGSKTVLYTTPRADDARRATFIAHDLTRGTKTTLAEDVDPSLPASESPWSAHWAIVADLRTTLLGDGGAAQDRTGSLIGVHPTTFERIPIADAVPVRGFSFSWQAPAIGYLWDFDPVGKVGSFEVLSMIDRKKFPVDKGVKEFEEVFAPRRGVAYVVDEAQRSGIYFVEADLHWF